MTWNQFLSACALCWATESRENNPVASCLRRCDKTPEMSLIQVAASAWALYKAENM